MERYIKLALELSEKGCTISQAVNIMLDVKRMEESKCQEQV